MSSGRVDAIALAPVKSLHLVHPDEVLLEAGGVRGDRRFCLVDGPGRLFNGKRDGRLVQIRPEWDEATCRLALTFADGRVVEGIVELGDTVPRDRTPGGASARRVLGPWDDAISTFVGRRLSLLWMEIGLTDRWDINGTVSLVSRASLARLRMELGVDEQVDSRRFRMLFTIDGVREHEEDTWIGTRVRIGGATIRVVGDVGRCLVTTQDADTGVGDLPTLKALGRYRRDGVTEPLPMGVYGAVVTPGRVHVGDPVEPGV